MEVGHMRRMRFLVAMLAAFGMTALVAAPASAQQQEGLVNLAVTDVNVQVPVAVAANICDVNVGVLAELERQGGAACEATATSLASPGKGDRDGNAYPGGTQDGLVNVYIADVNVQVPIAVAANVCDVNVGVLSQMMREGGAVCDVDGTATATRSPGRSGEAPGQSST
jgi:hypothetical protein